MTEQRPSIFKRFGRRMDRMLVRRRPEWDLFPNDEMRAEAIEQLDKELESSNRFWITVALVVLVVLGLLFMVHEIVQQLFPAVPAWALNALNIPGLLLGYAGVVAVWRGGVVRRLRRKLIEEGIPVCRRCGYALRGIDADRCPECGWEIDGEVLSIMTPRQAGGSCQQRPSRASSSSAQAGPQLPGS